MNYSDLIEKKLKLKKEREEKEKITNENYTKQSEEIKQNEEEKKQNVTNITPKKRGDYKNWEENWRISNNSILEELEDLGFELWINEKGEFVLKDIDTQKDETITSSNINRKISSILGKKVIIGSWKDTQNKVTPAEIISVASTDYRTDIKKRFFYIQRKNKKKWYLNSFTPTEYMNYTDKPKDEPKTILKLIRHLVNYKEDRYHYFLNWFAYYWITFKKPQTAIVLKGMQGAGKGIFAMDVISPLFGKNQVAIITNDVLENKFKADKFENKSFYIFEETSKGDAKSNKDVKEFIKQIITNEIVPMDRKHKKGVDVKITAPSLFFTNEVKFLEIEPSDRRFSVFSTGDKIIHTDFLGFGSYEALAEQIKKELPDFARYLYHFEVNEKLANTPMDTPEKRIVTQITNNAFQKFLIALKSKDLEFFDILSDSEEIDNKMLFNEIETAFKKGRIKRALITKIFNALFQKNISSQRLLEELKGIDPELFSTKNIFTINGVKYIQLS